MALLCLAFTTFSVRWKLRHLTWMSIVCWQLLAALEAKQEAASFLAEMWLSKTSVAVPETFDIELILHYPKEYRVDTKALQQNLLSSYTAGEKPFKLLSSSSQKAAGKINKETISYTLQPQVPGHFPITFLNIDFFNPNLPQNPIQLFSDIKYIKVTLPPTSKTIDVPIAEPVDLSARLPLQWDEMAKSDWLKKHALAHKKTFPWLLCFGVLALYLAAFLIRFPKKKEQLLEPKSKEIKDKAKVALDKMLASKKPSAEQAASYTYYLVQWVRCAFEEKLQEPATRQTSEEFWQMQDTKNRHIAGPLKDFLKKADRIKFAKDSPSISDCQALIYEAEEIVKKISENS